MRAAVRVARPRIQVHDVRVAPIAKGKEKGRGEPRGVNSHVRGKYPRVVAFSLGYEFLDPSSPFSVEKLI